MSRIMTIIDNISNQAKLALLAGVIMFMSSLTKINYSRINIKVVSGLLAIFGSIVLWTYAIDCYSKGQCEILAWVVSAYIFITSLLLVIG